MASASIHTSVWFDAYLVGSTLINRTTPPHTKNLNRMIHANTRWSVYMAINQFGSLFLSFHSLSLTLTVFSHSLFFSDSVSKLSIHFRSHRKWPHGSSTYSIFYANREFCVWCFVGDFSHHGYVWSTLHCLSQIILHTTTRTDNIGKITLTCKFGYAHAKFAMMKSSKKILFFLS